MFFYIAGYGAQAGGYGGQGTKGNGNSDMKYWILTVIGCDGDRVILRFLIDVLSVQIKSVFPLGTFGSMGFRNLTMWETLWISFKLTKTNLSEDIWILDPLLQWFYEDTVCCMLIVEMFLFLPLGYGAAAGALGVNGARPHGECQSIKHSLTNTATVHSIVFSWDETPMCLKPFINHIKIVFSIYHLNNKMVCLLILDWHFFAFYKF